MKAVIIDDEKRSIDNLEWALQTYCPEVELIAQFQSPATALAQLPTLTFDLLFLDIAMPGMNGFDLLLHLSEHPFSVVFTTAHNGAFLKRLHDNKLCYLLKPFDDEELKQVVDRFSVHAPAFNAQQLGQLRNLGEAFL